MKSVLFLCTKESCRDGCRYLRARGGHRGTRYPTRRLVLPRGCVLTPDNITVESLEQQLTSLDSADVEFNVSGMFAMPTPASNQNNHLDYDCGTVERKRPGSMVGPENESARKDK